MNVPSNPSVDELRELVRNEDDNRGLHVMWVDQEGDVHLDIVDPDRTEAAAWETSESCAYRMSFFVEGNSYTGAEAAKDDDWMVSLHKALVPPWADNVRDGRVVEVGHP